MRAKDDGGETRRRCAGETRRRCVGSSGGSSGAAGGCQSVLDTWDDGFLHPCHIVLDGRHGLAQTDQEPYVGIVLDEGSNRLAGIVADKRCDGTVAVLRLQSVMIGKGLAEDDVIEHLDDPDATAVSLMGEKREHVNVLLECRVIDFQGKGIVLQLHQRGKGMTVPEVERVILVLYHHVQVLHPFLLVVEPREVLWRVGVFIDAMPWQIDRLLQSDARAAHDHAWRFLDGLLRCHRNKLNKAARLTNAVCQLHTAIDDTCGIVTCYHDAFCILGYCIAFSRSLAGITQRNLAVRFLGSHGTTHFSKLFL